VLISDDFYPALNRGNVELVTDGIAAVRGDRIVTVDGTERPVDMIIYGTGFDVGGNLTRVKVFGREAAELNQPWNEVGIGAHKGITVAGFPNFFMLLGPNTGLGHTSVVLMIERQIGYALSALDLLDRRSGRFIDVRTEAQRAFVTGCRTALRERSGSRDAAAGTSTTRVATSPSGRTFPGSTGSRRAT
jgi:cation diffusion facilitator CzcD-associated flavoprotein CzcO